MIRLVCVLLLLVSSVVGNPPTVIPACDPRITIHGRTFCDGTSVQFDWSCVTLSLVGLYSVKTVHVNMNGGLNRFAVIVNGVHTQSFATTNETATYLIADGLIPSQLHTIDIVKETEAGLLLQELYSVRVFSFMFDEPPFLPHDAVRDHRKKILFIGDSDTVGHNVLAPADTCATQIPLDTESCIYSFPGQLSRHLNADFQVIGQSGNGVMRGPVPLPYFPPPQLIMPDMMNRTVSVDAEPLWNPSNFKPDIISVYLGGNDYYPEILPGFPPVTDAEFIPAYVQLLHTLRREYPETKHIMNLCGGEGDVPNAPCHGVATAVAQVAALSPSWSSILSYTALSNGTWNNYTCDGERDLPSQTKLAWHLTPLFGERLCDD